ncbi:hypothetical protein MTBLM5_190018 [Magnetospirillum sp. LM-5]|uniref:hypothetical protein n=1 Tax=Magnetospirillum sp. LM-5 TaxID=2681466 RepID=UPI00137F7678|nr:hypothetical protein [Magnetospirillum sp. LM-5]CAA7616090.1 hypothetical protein MTBLM5_190018 [Magnetospirillum sp. LM-5]
MPVALTHDSLKMIKRATMDFIQGVGSSHLSEAIASGMGYRTNISLKTALAQGAVITEIDDEAFNGRLRALGHSALDGAPLSAALHEATLRRIRKVADQFPRMTLNGLNPSIGRRYVYKTHEDWAQSRDEFLGDGTVEMFLKAELWLAHCKKAPKMHRRWSSYGMKHAVEKWIKRTHPEVYYYLANGAFIAAAVANGFSVEEIESTDGLNCFLSIATHPTSFPGISKVCRQRDTYEVENPEVISRFVDLIASWARNRATKPGERTPYFFSRHGVQRIQLDAKGRIRISGFFGWSVLMTVDGHGGDLGSLGRIHVVEVILRGSLDSFATWLRESGLYGDSTQSQDDEEGDDA